MPVSRGAGGARHENGIGADLTGMTARQTGPSDIAIPAAPGASTRSSSGKIQRGIPIRVLLIALVLATGLPAIGVAAALLLSFGKLAGESVHAQVQETARAMAWALDSEIATLTSTLTALADSPSLQTGDLRRFYGHAAAVAERQNRAFALFDREGRQLFNTRFPFEQDLPFRADMSVYASLFGGARSIVSSLVTGTATRRESILIGVPVILQGATEYVLATAVTTDELMHFLTREDLPKEWGVSIIDRHGNIVARTRDPERFIGQKANADLLTRMAKANEGLLRARNVEGVTVLGVFRRAHDSGLTVAIGVPESAIEAPLSTSLRRLGLGGLAVLGCAFACAALLARRIARPMAALAAAATRPEAERLTAASDDSLALREVETVRQSLLSTVDALRVSEAQHRALLKSLDDGVFVAQDFKFVFANPALPAMLGYSMEEFVGLPFEAVVAPEDLPIWRDRHRRCMTGDAPEPPNRYEVRVLPSNGAPPIWVELHARRIDLGGRPAVLGIVRDIGERKQTEARLKLLAREVDHRAKNMLAVTQVMLRQTKADTVKEYARIAQGRVAALARAHTLLSESRWESADLHRLVAEELAPFRREDQSRVRAEGPAVALSPAAAQALAMALHELATNAAKHGALSVREGRVVVAWREDTSCGLVLQWTETGGPAAGAPTRRGLGTGVIERAIRDQLDGAVRFDWRPEGLCCELVVPATKLAKAA